MPKNKTISTLIKSDQTAWDKARAKLPKLIAEMSVNHFRMNFRKQGFEDTTVEKWKPRKKPDYTGKGKRRREKKTKRGILIGSGSGKKLSRSIRQLKISKNTIIVGSTVHYAGVHNYGLRAGRGKGFTMPQRKFIGHSNKLNKNITKLIFRQVRRGRR